MPQLRRAGHGTVLRIAFRRLYAGSVVLTVMKELAIAAIYGVTAAVAFVAMIYWVSIAA